MIRTTEGRLVDIIEADMATKEIMIEIEWNRELRIVRVQDLVADRGIEEIEQGMFQVS